MTKQWNHCLKSLRDTQIPIVPRANVQKQLCQRIRQMPSFNEHLKHSEERTGQSYKELNEWLDGDDVALLQRLQRHIRITKYSKYVHRQWGEEGLKEYRNHLSDDFGAFFSTLRSVLWGKLQKQTTRTTDGGEGKR